MNTITLTGLRGDNPMSFLAALGIVRTVPEAKIKWSLDGDHPAILRCALDEDELINYLVADKSKLLESELFQYKDVRLKKEVVVPFLSGGSPDEHDLRWALITDITIDNSKGLSKPTDLYFTTGQQKFLAIVKEIGGMVTEDLLKEGIFGPWLYSVRGAKTLTLDPRDDRNFALMATEPSTTPKQTMPALDWLAFIGFALLPVFGMDDRVLTPGASGPPSHSSWAWPLWDEYIGADVIRSLFQLIPRNQHLEKAPWQIPKGVFAIFQSEIARIGQGYGRMLPPKQVYLR